MKTNSVCPKCGKAFQCDHLNGDHVCWCFKLRRPTKDIGDYKTCLCKECLGEF